MTTSEQKILPPSVSFIQALGDFFSLRKKSLMRRNWFTSTFLAALFLASSNYQAIALKQRIPVKINNKNIMPPRDEATSADSSVLRELKETIRKQAAEIEDLKRNLKKSSPPTRIQHGGGGSHGGGAGIAADEIALYLNKPFYSVALHRVGWLSLFLVSLSLTALIMNGFERTLERQLELAYFVPLLAGHGGNTGGQTVGTVLSALSSGKVTVKDAPRVISKEALSGVMVGSILGTLVGPIAHYVMGVSTHVSTVVFFTLPWVSTIAATLGSSIPFLCVALGLDPSVIAAPAMTSFVDVTGLMSYFLIANKVFSLFGIEL